MKQNLSPKIQQKVNLPASCWTGVCNSVKKCMSKYIENLSRHKQQNRPTTIAHSTQQTYKCLRAEEVTQLDTVNLLEAFDGDGDLSIRVPYFMPLIEYNILPFVFEYVVLSVEESVVGGDNNSVRCDYVMQQRVGGGRRGT